MGAAGVAEVGSFEWLSCTGVVGWEVLPVGKSSALVVIIVSVVFL